MKSLLTRLLLVVSVALVPALGFQAYTEIDARRIRQQLVEDEALRLVRLLSSEQQRIAEGADQILDAISSSPAVQDSSPGECQIFLANLLHRLPRYNYATVIGLDGHTVCAPGPFDASIDLSDRLYFRLALQTAGFVIGESTIGRFSKQPAIHMAKPLTNRDGVIAGVVDVALSLDWLGHQLEHLDLPPGSAVSVRDRNGTVLARNPEGAGFVGEPMPEQMRFSLEGAGAKVVRLMNSDGRLRIMAYSPPGAEPKGLRIAVGLDPDVALAPMTQANRTGMLLIVLAGSLALVMTYVVGTHLIRRPLDRLLEVADRWRTGDLAARIGIPDDGSEFGRLGAAFDSMAAAQEARVGGEVAAREAAQIRAAHAERVQALGQLAGGIAHDFNNVLQAVAGAAVLIERRPADEMGVRRLARLALEAVERGASITRRLLAFGRRSDLRAEALDAASVLNGLREILVHTLGAAITVEVRPEAGVPPLLADKGQLETALVNLATNARDAMPVGGQLTLSTSTETVEPDGPPHPAGLGPGRYVRLTVADTGAGMDAATRERAVEPFFTTKDVGAGTGLGLPMAKGFAEQSGGALTVESSPGAGTTISLWLPVAGSVAIPAPMTEPPVAAELATGASTRRALILLVDDEDPVRELLAEDLEDAGYRVLATASGAAALALLATAETVDILITDLSMPGMDGLAVIRAAQERLPGLPAVLLTGYAGDGATLAVAGTVSGTFSLLRKPVSRGELIDRVRTLLAGAAKARSKGARMDAMSGPEAG